jgi:Carboxypeptidase regulatory-like domain
MTSIAFVEATAAVAVSPVECTTARLSDGDRSVRSAAAGSFQQWRRQIARCEDGMEGAAAGRDAGRESSMTRDRRMRWTIIACTAVLGALVGATVVRAQVAGRTLAISGTIIDAEDGAPLAFAAVTLEPGPSGAFPGGAAAALRQTRVTLTDSVGGYRFASVVEGEYRLHVQRTGYRSRSVDVRVRPESDARVSVALEIDPVPLEAVTVAGVRTAAATGSYARRASDADDRLIADALRTAAERLRQREYLSSDVRVVTHADVVEGLSLGETDLFRALQRLPGVSGVDEWSAELLTRGAPWDQTRVYFDGMPLFNSLHALGVLAGVNADAIGAAFLHPGMQPAALGGAAAGALDIRSRRGNSSGELAGVGEVSLASARLALDRGSVDGGHAWMIAGRRSYIDLATRALAPLFGENGAVPYAFHDVAGRGDLRIGEASVLEASGILARDHAYGEIFDVLEGTRAKWGGGAARATLSAPLGGLAMRNTLGYSGYASTLRDVPGEAEFQPPTSAARNRLDYVAVRGELAPLESDGWSAGYELARYDVRYRGNRPGASGLTPRADSVDYDAGLDVVAGWLQRRVQLGAHATVDVGARVEGGTSAQGRGAVGMAPRASARFRLASQLTASAAVGRTWQYTQALTPTGVSAVRGLASDFLWLIAADTVPALRTDIVSAGLEQWIQEQWILALNGYLRRARGMTVPDPRPGVLLERPLFVHAANDAHGVEVSLRRITGRWTGSAAYTYGRSTMRQAELTYAAPYDQRHTVDATVMVRLGGSWLLGAAYTGATGTPYTRRWEGAFACDASGCTTADPARQGPPAAQRRPTYHSLDVNVEHVKRFRDWQLSGFLQLRNLLNQENQGRYVSTETTCFARCGSDDADTVERDEFLPALPTVPLLGVRVSF